MDVSTRKERRRGDFLPGHEGATRRESNNEVGAALGLSTSDTTCRIYFNLGSIADCVELLTIARGKKDRTATSAICGVCVTKFAESQSVFIASRLAEATHLKLAAVWSGSSSP
jgi:hypothetical protein